MGLKKRISKKKDLVVREIENKKLKVSPTPEMLIQQALDQKTPVETMEKLMAMRKELKEEMARDAFMRDLAGFQGDCPVIVKNREVLNKDKKSIRYFYATLDSIINQISPYLMKWGFSYTIQTVNEKDPPAILSILTVHHVEGHSRDTEFRCPIGSSEYMTIQQAYASASTFSKRYCIQNGFGIVTGDGDDDGQSGEVGKEKEKKEEKKDAPPEKSKEYIKLEKLALRSVSNKYFKSYIEVDNVQVDLDIVKKQAQEMLAKKVYSMKKIKEVADKVEKYLEIARTQVSPPAKDEVVIEKPEVVVKAEVKLVKSTEYLEIEARIIKDILHPEFIGKVLFADDDGKTQEVDLGHYKRKMPDILAKNVCTLEELEKKADIVARLLLVATTKHEKFETPNPKPAGMVDNPTNQEQMDAEMKQEGQGTFDGFDGPVNKDTEGNLSDGG